MLRVAIFTRRAQVTATPTAIATPLHTAEAFAAITKAQSITLVRRTPIVLLALSARSTQP